MESKWFVLFVKTGYEEKVKLRLEYRFSKINPGLRFVIPKRKLKERKGGIWRERTRVLFPGYVLVRGEIGVDDYYAMKNIPDLYKLICSEKKPVPLFKEEAEIFEQLLREEDTIGYSDVLMKNGKVIVVDGPLLSMEGQIVNINKRKGRAKVRLTFLGEERVVELGINILEPKGD